MTYLPRRSIQLFSKKQIIYSSRNGADRLYREIAGSVKVAWASDHGREIIARIVSVDGLFGETGFVGVEAAGETAVALENVAVMSWDHAWITQEIEHEPRLGMALSQYFAHQCVQLKERIQRMARYKELERVMLALLQLGEIMGTRLEDNRSRIVGLTHLTIAQYVGTRREQVTSALNRLRRMGLIRYSWNYLDVDVPAVQARLRSPGHAPAYGQQDSS
jgi:CRP-like cAMP-binding protein